MRQDGKHSSGVVWVTPHSENLAMIEAGVRIFEMLSAVLAGENPEFLSPNQNAS
jgi:hypothetical protein